MSTNLLSVKSAASIALSSLSWTDRYSIAGQDNGVNGGEREDGNVQTRGETCNHGNVAVFYVFYCKRYRIPKKHFNLTPPLVFKKTLDYVVLA